MDSLLYSILDILSELASGQNDQRDDLSLYALSTVFWAGCWMVVHASSNTNTTLDRNWWLIGCSFGLWNAASMLITATLILHDAISTELALAMYNLYSPTLQFLTRICIVAGIIVLTRKIQARQPLHATVAVCVTIYLVVLWVEWFLAWQTAISALGLTLTFIRNLADIVLGVTAVLLTSGSKHRIRVPAIITFISFALSGLLSLINLLTQAQYSDAILPIRNSLQLWSVPLMGYIYFTRHHVTSVSKATTPKPDNTMTVKTSDRHELNNCFQAILTLSQLDREEIVHPQKVIETLDEIRLSAQRGGQVLKSR